MQHPAYFVLLFLPNWARFFFENGIGRDVASELDQTFLKSVNGNLTKIELAEGNLIHWFLYRIASRQKNKKTEKKSNNGYKVES